MQVICPIIAANEILFGNTFPYYYAITWQITATSADPPQEEENSGGNTSGGSFTKEDGVAKIPRRKRRRLEE